MKALTVTTGEPTIMLIEALGAVKFPKDFVTHFHSHIFCHRGSLSFLFNGIPYTCKTGEFVFWFADSNLADVKFSKNFKASVLLIEKTFLNNNIPDQSWSINAFLHSKENPVLHISDQRNREKVLQNFRLLHQKFLEKAHRFYREVLNLQMQLFILEMWHTFAEEFEHRKHTLQSGTLYERFMQLVQEHSMKEREVQYYARQLNITPKYLNYVCKQSTGVSASEWIQRHAKERIEVLLKNKNVNIAEIAEEMEFSSRSFFTRYVKKLLGVTPSEFRNRLA